MKIVMDFANVTPDQLLKEVFTFEAKKQWDKEAPVMELMRNNEESQVVYQLMPKPPIMFVS